MNSFLKSFLSSSNCSNIFVRYGHMRCTKNVCHRPKPKYRGIKRWEGQYAVRGEILVKQRTLKFHPGLNVRLSLEKREVSLFAMQPGIVHYSCEVFDPDYSKQVVRESYAGREDQKIYKKYLNIIPEPQHYRFKLIETI